MYAFSKSSVQCKREFSIYFYIINYFQVELVAQELNSMSLVETIVEPEESIICREVHSAHMIDLN